MPYVHFRYDRDIREGHTDRVAVGHLGFFRLKAGASDQYGAGMLRADPPCIAELQECAVQDGGREREIIKIPDESVLFVAADKFSRMVIAGSDQILEYVDTSADAASGDMKLIRV